MSNIFRVIGPEPGDVNSDGNLDLTDALLVLQMLSGILVPQIASGSEVSLDGKVGIEEVIYILQKAAGHRNGEPGMLP